MRYIHDSNVHVFLCECMYICIYNVYIQVDIQLVQPLADPWQTEYTTQMGLIHQSTLHFFHFCDEFVHKTNQRSELHLIREANSGSTPLTLLTWRKATEFYVRIKCFGVTLPQGALFRNTCPRVPSTSILASLWLRWATLVSWRVLMVKFVGHVLLLIN